MKLKLTFFTILLATFALAQPATLVEKKTKSPEVFIPYEKYVLANGLTLLIHEDHSDPMAYVNVTYHVGSNRELVGRSGFAHFFEHMMFEGSAHAPDGTHDKLTEGNGGYNNGSTNNDYTNYYEVIPSNQLERILWLEADRMGFLLDAVTQDKFEVQRATVKNERGQNYDNSPYGLVAEKVYSAMYPFAHPYSWPVIGYIEDLNRADVNDLKRFFMRWYGPNNATLTVTGDVNPAEVVAMVEKYFNPIPKGPEVKNLPKQMATLDKTRYISYEDGNINEPMLTITWPTVHFFHEDEAALDALSSILGYGQSSVFYQAFQKKGLATETEIYNDCMELSGEFYINIFTKSGQKLAETEKLVYDALAQFEKRGVQDQDITKFLAMWENDVVSELESVEYKGYNLAQYQTLTGNPNYSHNHIEAYKKVTKEDIMRVYNKYIKGKPAVVLSVVPKGKGNLKAKPDNFVPPTAPADYKPDLTEYVALKYTQPVDAFDRSVIPPAGANPVVKIPPVYRENFDNGLRILGNVSDESPTVTMVLVLKSGHVMESIDKAGLAKLTANMLNQSTEHFTTEQMADELDKLGSMIDVYCGRENVTISVKMLKKNTAATLKLLEEKLLHPKFDKNDFKVEQKLLLGNIQLYNNYAWNTANNAFYALLYGNTSIFGTPVMGFKSSVSKLTVDDVKQFYQKYYAPDLAQLVVVGDISKDDMLNNIGFLKLWPKKGNIVLPEYTDVKQPEKTKIYIVNKNNAPQSEVRIGYLSLANNPLGDMYKSTIMSYPFGGYFSSRINSKQRETKGWTYGCYAWFAGTRYIGPYTISGAIKSAATDSSVYEFMYDLKDYAENGIKNDEFALTKNSLGQVDATKYETPQQKGFFLSRLLEYNLGDDYIDKQTAILNTITKDDINALAKKYLPYNNMYIVIVGDRGKIETPLKRLGYDIVHINTKAEVVK